MNSTAILIAMAYGVVTVVGSAVFLLLWRSTTRGGRIDEERLARREREWRVRAIGALTR